MSSTAPMFPVPPLPLTWVWYGPFAVLIRFADQVDESAFLRSQRLERVLEEVSLVGLQEVVPGFTTSLLIFSDWAASEITGQIDILERAWLDSLTGPDHDNSALIDRVEVPVVYSGLDLDRVAARHHLSHEAVCELHASVDYRVHCLGFAPGFPYLGGLPKELHTPRLDSPRLRIPSGSVAIGGEHAGIYSIASPGGWNLIGHTQMRLFRPETGVVEKMFPIRAGQRLRFVKVPGPSSSEEAVDSGSLSETPACPERNQDQDPGRPVLRVDVAAAGITIQDLGRAGWRRFGVPASGAMDDHAAQWSNRLLQNPGHLPVLEMAGTGQRLEVLETGWLSVSGAGQVRSRDGKVHAWQAFRVQVGDRLEVVPGSGGVWTYLAVPHGFHNRSVLGSFSSFIRAGVGEVISSGTILRHSNAATFDWPESVAARRVTWTEQLTYEDAPVIRVWSAPQTSQFTDRTLELWTHTTWIVSQQMDRVGYRLEGPTLDPLEEAMISEPMLPGTIQVPSGGQPLITLADGPTLGGYPKLGVVDPYDLRRFAQVRPGQGVRFVWANR